MNFRRLLGVLFFCWCFILCAGSVSAATYYVDKDSIGGSCSGSNDGTALTTPFCTFSQAHSAVSAGDTVYFRAGTYSPIAITKSGSSGNYITFSRYAAETVIIDGAGSDTPIRLTNTRYVEVNGFETINAAGGNGGIFVRGTATTGIDYSLTNSSHNRVINNISHDNINGTDFQHGIYMRDTSYNVIQGNVLYENYATGITLDGNTNVTVEGNQFIGNTIYNNTAAGGNSDGININGNRNSGNIVRGNIIYANADDGIDTWTSSGNIIERNIVYNHTGPGDANGFKLGGTTLGGNNIVRYNIAYGNSNYGFDTNGSGGNEFYNNISFNNGVYGYEDGWREVGATGCDPETDRCYSIFKNNIGMNNGTANISANEMTKTSDYNLWYSAGSPKVSYDYVVYNTLAEYSTASGMNLDENSLFANPVFVNSGTADFRLQSTSPAINAGTDVSLTEDFNQETVPQGAAQDIGAFEFLLPDAATSLNQYKADGTTAIVTGNWTTESTVVFSFSMDSDNSSDSLVPQIELRPLNTAFSNIVTHSGSPVAHVGSPVTGTVTVTGLSANTQYHWQARVNNAAGDGAWLSYGGNAENAADFGSDTTAPSTPGTPSTTSPTADTTPTWTWTASTDAGSGLVSPAYTVEWSESSTFSSTVSSSTASTNSFTHTIDLANGTWYFRVQSSDVAGNDSIVSANGSVVIDTGSPGISSVDSVVSSSGATITWATDEAASSQVEYGLTTSYGTSTAETDTSPRVTSHEVALSGLASCTTYHYRVKSSDATSNQVVGSDNTFTTAGCAGGATVVAQSAATITTASGGTLSLLSTGLGTTLTVPAGFAAGDAVFQIKQLEKNAVIAATSVPSGYSLIGSYIYDFEALSDNSTKITTFLQPITVEMKYQSSDVTNINEASLLLYRHDGSSWIALSDCAVDTTAKTVTCTTSSFSVFGLFGQVSAVGSGGSSSSSGSSTSTNTNFGPSSPPTCSDLKPEKAPQLYQINATKTSATMFFSPSGNNTSGYVIAYGHSATDLIYGTRFARGASDGGAVVFTINDLKPNTTYYFKVRGDHGCTPGEWSNALRAKTIAKNQSLKVRIFTAWEQMKEVVLSWTR